MATRFSYRSFSREEEEGSKIAQIARLSQFTASFATSVISRTANPSINEEIRRNQHLRSTLPMFPAGTIYNIPLYFHLLILPLHFAGLVFQIRQIDRKDPISFSSPLPALQLIHTYAFARLPRAFTAQGVHRIKVEC